MARLTLKSFSLGSFSVNCYLLCDDDTKKAIVIDAPCGVEEVLACANDNKSQVQCIIITHGHFDHIEGLSQVNFPFYIHREDKELLYDSELNLSSLLGNSFKLKQDPLLLKEGDLDIASFNINVIHTPGHTPGSVSLKINNWLFCGDTLFFNSVGRTDIPYASQDLLIASIKDKIVVLDDAVTVFPGHGPSTTIGREKKNNPFLS